VSKSFLLAAGALVAAAAAVFAEPIKEVPLEELKAAYRRPDSIPFPSSNPFSDAKLELGHMLFFEPRLSAAGNVSCATCHNPALGWEDATRTSVGAGAVTLGRHTPTILNLAWTEPLMWDGRKDTLEEQALGPIEAEVEMNMPIEQVIARLRSIDGYKPLFAKAFPELKGEISGETIGMAIATFERTIVSNKAPFDLWIEGREDAIGEAAKRGFRLFNGKANCAACHSGWRFTDDGFHDIGLASPDPGRALIVPDVPQLKHAFKTPGLRNIAERAPYMHDGSVATLAETIRHYDTGYIDRESLSPNMRRLGLSAREIDDLVAFMLTLSSKDDPIPVPTLPANH
jgi:cytochrome c peroxidase